jgi:hypothetical protein
MRFGSVLVGLLVAVPAAAQQLGPTLPDDRATGAGRFGWWGGVAQKPTAQDASPWRGGMFVAPRSGQGFSLARAGALDPGLRAAPDVLESLPQSPRLLAPGGETVPVDGGAYFGYRYSNWTFSSAVRQSLDDQRLAATRIDFGASYGFSLTERHLITLSGGLTLGQSGAAIPTYGAMGSDALSRSAQRYGEPGAGFRLSWLYTLDRNLYVNTSLGYDRLYGDPAEGFGSERGTTTFGTVFGYRFY